MPKSIDWLNFIYVNLGFIAQVLIMYIYTSIDEIKKNWPLYRCNPLYMPLSDNIAQDFTYCIQNTQINFMGFLWTHRESCKTPLFFHRTIGTR